MRWVSTRVLPSRRRRARDSARRCADGVALGGIGATSEQMGKRPCAKVGGAGAASHAGSRPHRASIGSHEIPHRPRVRAADPAVAAGAAGVLALDYSLHYTVRDEIIRSASAAPKAAAQRRFIVDPGAGANLRDVRRRSGGPLVAGGRCRLAPDWSADDCLDHRADLGRIADRRREDVGWRTRPPGGDSDLVTSPAAVAAGHAHPGDATVRLDPPSAGVWSAPWRHDGDGRYRIRRRRATWAANRAVVVFRGATCLGGDAQLALPACAMRLRRTGWRSGSPPFVARLGLRPPAAGAGAGTGAAGRARRRRGAIRSVQPRSGPRACCCRSIRAAVGRVPRRPGPRCTSSPTCSIHLGDGGRYWRGPGHYWQEALAQAPVRLRRRRPAGPAAGFARAAEIARRPQPWPRPRTACCATHAFQRVLDRRHPGGCRRTWPLRQRSGGRLGAADALPTLPRLLPRRGAGMVAAGLRRAAGRSARCG